jgi:tRNA (adenine57-N1/adenine58-N1)-methyltransferase
VVKPFAAGDPCLLIDSRGRRYLIELVDGKEFHYHRGFLAHDEVIGDNDGSRFRSSMGAELLAIRPRLADYTEKMGRGATIVYPKDAAAILMWADISPGLVVLEAGTGSGALTMALARAVIPDGRVVSVDVRVDHAERAHKLINGFFGRIPAHVDLRVGEVENVVAEVQPDRLVLDVPEPWHVVEPAASHLTAGGIFCCYLPTVPQIQTVRAALSETGVFTNVSTFEVLVREWAVEGRSVRPSHRMIGHTGFITVAKKVNPRL